MMGSHRDFDGGDLLKNVLLKLLNQIITPLMDSVTQALKSQRFVPYSISDTVMRNPSASV